MPASPDRYQPPLRRRASVARYLGALVISALAWSPYALLQWREARPLFWIDIGLGVVALCVVHLRRRLPLAIALGTAVLCSYSSLAGGPATLATVSIATRRRLREILMVGVVGLAGAQFFTRTQDSGTTDPFWVDLALNATVVAATLGWGMFIGSRRELLWTLRDRAEKAEAERDLRVDKARGDERSRIAREMHDVLAHRISQVSMHAGALAFREDLAAEDMRASARIISTQANEALIDLRAVLGVLRDDSTGQLLDKPQPTYADLAALVEEALANGMHLEFETALPQGEGIPETAGRTLYRIVQEGLTNARKHAPATTVFLTVSGTPDEGIDVVLRNPLGFHSTPRAPGAGLGLIGLSERVELVGGSLEHREDGSMFVLHAWIPWVA